MNRFKKNRWVRKFSEQGHLYQHEKTADLPIMPKKEPIADPFAGFKMTQEEQVGGYAN